MHIAQGTADAPSDPIHLIPTGEDALAIAQEHRSYAEYELYVGRRAGWCNGSCCVAGLFRHLVRTLPRSIRHPNGHCNGLFTYERIPLLMGHQARM
jgi:hypothetical protein